MTLCLQQVLGFELDVCMLGKHSLLKLHPQPCFCFCILRQVLTKLCRLGLNSLWSLRQPWINYLWSLWLKSGSTKSSKCSTVELYSSPIISFLKGAIFNDEFYQKTGFSEYHLPSSSHVRFSDASWNNGGSVLVQENVNTVDFALYTVISPGLQCLQCSWFLEILEELKKWRQV